MAQRLEELFAPDRIRDFVKAHVCYECGEEVQDTMYHIGGEDYICEDCRDRYYYYCEDCDELAHESNIVTVDGNRYICLDCADRYYTCSHCHGLYSYDRIAVDTYYITLCMECYNEDFFTCPACGEIHRLEDSEFVDDCLYCNDCADNYGCILSYGTKPSPVFFGGAQAGYGVELEIDNGNNRMNAAWDIRAAGGDHIYLKEDGSLTCAGFEIVTHPATLDYHVNHFPWADICQTALSYGYRSHDTHTCGLHIHASRELFGVTQIEQDLTIAKIMLLIDRWYDSYIVGFARRDLAKMRQWADKPNAGIQPEDEDYDAVQKSKKLVGDRYRAVNLCNSHTVEFRFFRGTLKRDTIIASIQWVDTIIQYCRKIDLRDLFKVTWEDIFGNTGHAELTEYLRQRNLYNAKEDN